MLSRIVHRLTFANVIATLALLLALSGGAYAASRYLITSTKQISPKVLRHLNGRRGRRGPAGPAGATGKQGPAGRTGATGKTGKTGPAGPTGKTGATGREGPRGPQGDAGPEGSPWTAGGTLPPGRTETGTWAFTSQTQGAIRVAISFTIPTAAPLSASGGRGPIELYEPGEDEQDVAPNCKGSVQEPSAEPGYICIYAAEALESQKVQLEIESSPVRSSGVVLHLNATSATPSSDEGAWAVTAPLGK